MLFRRIVLCALLAGLISGVVYGLYQQFFISPIIYAAESYEVLDAAVEQSQSDGHSHSHTAWSPESSLQRILSTILTNVLIAASYGLILMAFMVLHNYRSKKAEVNQRSGIGWGIALLLIIFIAPTLLGMPPELPGTIAADLQQRQIWWVFTAVFSTLGVACLYYGKPVFKALGLLAIALPHIVGAPHIPLQFANTDPQAVIALTALTHQFLWKSLLGMVILTLLLGVICGWLCQRYLPRSLLRN